MYYNRDFYEEIDSMMINIIVSELKLITTTMAGLVSTLSAAITYVVIITPVRIYEYIKEYRYQMKKYEMDEQIRFQLWKEDADQNIK